MLGAKILYGSQEMAERPGHFLAHSERVGTRRDIPSALALKKKK